MIYFKLEGEEHSFFRVWRWHDFSHPTLKACNSPYMQYYFKSFCFAFLSYIFISDRKVEAKTNRNRNWIFFIPLGIPRVAHWIISFMLHISSPTNWYLYRWVSWNISEAINKNSTSAFNYLDDFRLFKCNYILDKPFSDFLNWTNFVAKFSSGQRLDTLFS